MKKIILGIAIFAVFFQTSAFCQTGDAVINNAVSRLKTLITDHIIEKAYLQFDRPYAYYVAGDVVYFKAYITMGERHEPSTISGVLHVDLINKDDNIMKSIALQLADGTGWGDFALPDTLQKGSYRIRAYTDWMRNDKNPYFFDQFISVSSLSSAGMAAENTSETANPSLQFFPEGGNLVADLPSKVAFKAIGTNGLGINVKGVIIDNENKEVAKITAAHLGMGVFDFIPEQGKTYKAKVTFGNGSQSTVDLPAAQASGISLAVNTADPSKVSIEIRANRAYYKENINKQLNLLLYYGGAMQRYSPKLDNAVLGLDLAAGTFHTGVLQVTLLSQTGEPLAERLSFIQNPDLLNLSVNANKTVYAKRENVQLSLLAKNKDGSPVAGSFSVSVVDESKIAVDENSESTILSNLLLTTDVKGYVEKPNYYFANVTKETRANLDALMLTQGYRRFVWKDLLDNNTAMPATTFAPEKGIDISGQLKTKRGEPIDNSTITLVPQSGGAVQVSTTNANGNFRFTNVSFSGGSHFILKTTVGKDGVLSFDPTTPGPAVTPANPLASRYNANADILASLQSNQIQGVMTASNGVVGIPLKEANVTVVKKAGYRSTTLGGSGHADQVIMGDDIRNAPTLSTALNGRAHGIQFNGGIPALQTGMVISQQSASIAANQSAEPMLVIVDGADLGRGVNIDDINPANVEVVEILKGANSSIYGEEGGQGVMVITTKQGGQADEPASKEMSPGIFSIEPKGIYKAREFYSPNYAANQAAANTPDQRTTIFWKPDVITDASGNASFGFFNADGTGTYRVDIQGIDSKGNLGVQVLRYKVQ